MRLFCALCLALLLGCHATKAGPGITMLVESPPDSLDDWLALTANGQRISQLIVPGLVAFDDHGQPVPALAESFEQLDPLTLEVKLRPNVTFHDGAPLTSADVKATYDAALTGAFKSPRVGVLEPVASVEAVDPLTVRFHLKRPYAPLLAQLTFGILPRSRVSGPARKLQDHSPIGAGPFRFVAWPDEDHLELEAYDGFWAGKPKIPRLYLRVVRDETTRVLELLKGRADLVQNALSPAVLPVFASDKHLRVLSRDGTGYAYLAFNLREKPLDDVRVRRAICMAIDVAPIVEHKFHGLAVPATGMLPREHWAYEKTTPCAHDLAAAKRLLDEAGYRDPDGDGPLPRMVLSFKTSTDRFRRSVALVLKDQLAQIGIELDVRSLEFGTFFGDVRKGNFQLFTLKWAAIIEPDLMRSVFGSEFIPSAANQFAGLNREAYANPELDALLERATHADPALRRTLYGKAQEILAHDLPYLPLWHESTVAVASDRLQDFAPSSQGFFWPLAFAREVDR